MSKIYQKIKHVKSEMNHNYNHEKNTKKKTVMPNQDLFILFALKKDCIFKASK